MARNAKVVIGTAVVVLLSILFVATGYVLAGAGVFVVGILGVAVLHQRQTEDEGESEAGKSKLDRALEERGTAPAEPTASTAAPPKPAAPGEPASGGLPTWSPSTPAEPAEPPDSTWAPEHDKDADQQPARPGRSTWHAWDDFDTGPVAEEYDAENPLAALDRLDDIDPIAEVERLEGISGPGPSSGFSFSSVATPIDESAVQTDDDIMAASQATELHVSQGEDSELARLLAKVQQRLAAYE